MWVENYNSKMIDVPTWALDVGSVILVRPEIQHRVTPIIKGSKKLINYMV